MMEEMQAKARKRAESAAANPQAISPRGKPVKEKAVDAKKPMTMMEEMQAKARKRAASAAASSPQPAAPRGAPMATATPTSTSTPTTPTPSTAAREGASIAAAASAPVPAAATSGAAAGGSAPAGGAGGGGALPPLAPGEITFTLAQLSGKGGGGQAAELERIDQTQREMYLSDADVQQYFGCQLWELPAMPKWKRTKKKKDLGLF